MKQIQIVHPDLGTNTLEVRLSSFWKSPKLFFNDTEIQRKKKTYSISEQLGKKFEVKLTQYFWDYIPQIKINDKLFEVARPLKWYEYLWMGLPFLLVISGGLIGALMGIFALKVNSFIFRSERSNLEKYAQTFGVNVGLTIVFIIISILINTALKR